MDVVASSTNTRPQPSATACCPCRTIINPLRGFVVRYGDPSPGCTTYHVSLGLWDAKAGCRRMQRRGRIRGGLQAYYSARTDVGRVRQINEDRVFAGELPLLTDGPEPGACHLLMVADGVGGLDRGAWASEKAVTVVTLELPGYLAVHEAREALQLALEAANESIWHRERSDAAADLSPAATTVVAVIVDDRHLWWANVGDSRAYLVTPNDVQRLTRDHSWVEEQVRQGVLAPEQA